VNIGVLINNVIIILIMWLTNDNINNNIININDKYDINEICNVYYYYIIINIVMKWNIIMLK